MSAVGRRHRLVLDPDAGGAEAVAGRDVLLVDDQVVTGWTLTLAARAVHDAGAASVVPVTLAVGG